MKMVLTYSPDSKQYVLFRQDAWGPVRLSFPLVFEFENIDEFVKKASGVVYGMNDLSVALQYDEKSKAVLDIVANLLADKLGLSEEPQAKANAIKCPRCGSLGRIEGIINMSLEYRPSYFDDNGIYHTNNQAINRHNWTCTNCHMNYATYAYGNLINAGK